MKYEFMCKVDALNNEKTQKRIAWLNTGMICSVIAVICELLIEQYMGLTFVIPFLFMLNLKLQLSKRLGYIDCIVRVSTVENVARVEMLNCVQIDGEMCSDVFETSCKRRIKVKYKKKHCWLQLGGKWERYYCNQQNEPVTKRIKVKKLNIYTNEENAYKIKELLKA